MAGMIEQEMQGPVQGDETPPSEEKPGGGVDVMDPRAVQESMQMPEQMRGPFASIITAGLKIMFDPQSHRLMLDELEKDGDQATNVGEGIAGLLALLFQEAKRSIPPQLLVPAGLVFLSHVAAFLKESGDPLDPKEYGMAAQIMIEKLAPMFGVDLDKLANAVPSQEPGIAQEAMAAPAGAPAAQVSEPDDMDEDD